METTPNFTPLFTTILLIVSGLIASSNGVDDRRYITPIESLWAICLVITGAVTVFLIWKLAELTKKTN